MCNMESEFQVPREQGHLESVWQKQVIKHGSTVPFDLLGDQARIAEAQLFGARVCCKSGGCQHVQYGVRISGS